MGWLKTKAKLLSAGGVRLKGKLPPGEAPSRAGPGAGEGACVFFSAGGHRVRLPIEDDSPYELVILEDGHARVTVDGEAVEGVIEETGCHCPRQAYITITEGCIFSCLYCSVPSQPMRIKTPEEVEALVESVIDRIDAISLTSGVAGSVEEDERRVSRVIRRLRRFDLPIGVSIYPAKGTPQHLHELGVCEVKFNLEAATPALFEKMCPGLSYGDVKEALHESVALFGKNRVFSNVILGLGETDEEMEECIHGLAQSGVIPVIRPLTPHARLSGMERPEADRLLKICAFTKEALCEAGLDPALALTMCTACGGCDLVAGRDEA